MYVKAAIACVPTVLEYDKTAKMETGVYLSVFSTCVDMGLSDVAVFIICHKNMIKRAT